MSNTSLNGKAKKTETVVLTYTEDDRVDKISTPSELKIKSNSNLNVLAKKTAKMKAILGQFPLPTEN